ncbi:hypothetical protein EVAR_51953_1 [Eumeta japonica]|uniref:Uncharacterized protein n=1 Tax=Eumeta variegata TaxID=151549 RepID=A0A4C1Y2P6_EUMVA|nr:hypothetical protein EVAR_51953_1 [Eumeta japonica]
MIKFIVRWIKRHREGALELHASNARISLAVLRGAACALPAVSPSFETTIIQKEFSNGEVQAYSDLKQRDVRATSALLPRYRQLELIPVGAHRPPRSRRAVGFSYTAAFSARYRGDSVLQKKLLFFNLGIEKL